MKSDAPAAEEMAVAQGVGLERAVVTNSEGRVMKMPLSSLTEPLANAGGGSIASDARVKELERLLAEKDRVIAQKDAEMASALAEKDEQLARAVAEKESALETQKAQVASADEKTAAQAAQGPPKPGSWWSVMGKIRKVAPGTK